jgi:putative alpha-1,2-mannosidase
MDDAGEMSSWYVFTALGLYPYSPADPNYIVCVPLFDEVRVNLGDKTLTLARENTGTKITELRYGNRKVDGYFISHDELMKGERLLIRTAPNDSAH